MSAIDGIETRRTTVPPSLHFEGAASYAGTPDFDAPLNPNMTRVYSVKRSVDYVSGARLAHTAYFSSATRADAAKKWRLVVVFDDNSTTQSAARVAKNDIVPANVKPRALTSITSKIGGVFEEAEKWLSAAREAALRGDTRLALRNLLRGFDVLLRCGAWERIASELECMCADEYPIEFCIAAMRITSDAADRIPGWSSTIEKLERIARRNGLDAGKIMRGLI